MKLVKPSYEFIEQQNGLDGLYKHIELIGRTCYKSEDKITPDSAKTFVDRLVKSGHLAMVEHGTLYLVMSHAINRGIIDPIYVKALRYKNNKYSKVASFEKDIDGKRVAVYYITTNLRVLIENKWQNDLKYLSEPQDEHPKRYTVKFICDRGVSHEFVRHRVMSFAQESTRYCNYSKDKFGNELTFIQPCWMPSSEWCENDKAGHIFLQTLKMSEDLYLELLSEGWKAQEARAILPNALKTELVVTGFAEDWNHFFSLRDDKAHAHPQAYELAQPLHEEFKNKGIL